jgi:hypothetical protein
MTMAHSPLVTLRDFALQRLGEYGSIQLALAAAKKVQTTRQ